MSVFESSLMLTCCRFEKAQTPKTLKYFINWKNSHKEKMIWFQKQNPMTLRKISLAIIQQTIPALNYIWNVGAGLILFLQSLSLLCVWEKKKVRVIVREWVYAWEYVCAWEGECACLCVCIIVWVCVWERESACDSLRFSLVFNLFCCKENV